MGDLEPRGELEPELASRLEAGARLAAALAGGAIGLVGGPGGVLAGAAAGWALSETLPDLFREVVQRVGPRASTRAAAAVVFMEADAEKRREEGDQPRDDGFFDRPEDDLQSDADGLLEAVLRQAADAYEEQKLPYLSRMFNSVAHDGSVSAADAQYLVGLAGRLTYRQLVALAVLSRHDEHQAALISATVNSTEGTYQTDQGVRIEIVDLLNAQVVGVGDAHRVSPINDPLVGLLPRSETGFGQLRLLPTGESLVRLMRLVDIPASEQRGWLTLLGAGDQPTSSE